MQQRAPTATYIESLAHRAPQNSIDPATKECNKPATGLHATDYVKGAANCTQPAEEQQQGFNYLTHSH
jgi:hypothetical protein